MPAIKYVNKDGVRLRGVTTIIGNNLGWNKNTLLAWQAREFKAGNDPTDKSKRALETGTLCHHYISCDFFGQEIDQEFKSKYSMDNILIAEKTLTSTKDLLSKDGYKITHSELSLISEEHQYGGTIDVVLDHNGIIVLGDIKTSNASKSCPTGIYPDHLIQLGAYYHLLLENKIVDPKEFMFIHVNKTDFSTENNVSIVSVKPDIIMKGRDTFFKLIELDRIHETKIFNL